MKKAASVLLSAALTASLAFWAAPPLPAAYAGTVTRASEQSVSAQAARKRRRKKPHVRGEREGQGNPNGIMETVSKKSGKPTLPSHKLRQCLAHGHAVVDKELLLVISKSCTFRNGPVTRVPIALECLSIPLDVVFIDEAQHG